MKKLSFASSIIALCALGLTLVGCGGTDSTTSKTSSISGRVTDRDGNPVRGATVQSVDAITTSSSSGSYVITGNRAEDRAVTAELIIGDTVYRGSNLARTYVGEHTSSVNIMIAPKDQLATLKGFVRDRFDVPLQGASVFAINPNGFSSIRAISDNDGEYRLEGLISNIPYELNAGGSGYSSDTDSVTLRDGEVRGFDFVLGSIGNVNFGQPTGLDYISYVSQPVSRSKETRAVEQIKRELDPKRNSKASTRLTPSGNPIEVELTWDQISNRDLLGWNIFRGSGNSTPQSIDFWREPLGYQYLDGDTRLAGNTTYGYRIAALATGYPDDANAEGPASDTLIVTTLSDLQTFAPFQNPLRFRASANSGADQYVAFVFDQFPDLGVTSIWNNSASPSSSPSIPYTGTDLAGGRTYYTIIVGFSDNRRARTISQVLPFSVSPL